MSTRNVVLTDRHADLIEGLVRSGRNLNASEVLREAARIGIADFEDGRYRSFASSVGLSDHLRALSNQAVARAADNEGSI